MKTSLILIALIAAAILPAMAERQPLVDGGRVPVPTIETAIKLVKEHHGKSAGGTTVFVDSANYERTPGKSVWKIGVRNEKQETGQLVYTVDRDGKVETDSVVKDG